MLDWFFFTIFSAVAYSMLDIIEKNLISSRIPSAVLLAIFLAIFYPVNLALIPIFFHVDLSPVPALAGFGIGAAMAPADSRPAKDWAIYPSREPLMHKIDSLTPKWKYPAWMWLKKYNGYPFSAEWLSAAFDYNQAPYFQSFMEIKVERSRNRIRLIPYGVHGQLRWSDLEYGGKGRPVAGNDDNLVEWRLPMN